MTDKNLSIVLVHGGFVDGSGWQGVHQALTADGYEVIVVQNPTVSLADDVAVTRRAIAAAKHPVVLVGHSYGGVVITEAGNDPKVARPRLYRGVRSRCRRVGRNADRQPAAGRARCRRSCRRRTASCSSTAPSSPLRSRPTSSPGLARFMADSQVPWGLEALGGKVTVPAWKSKPSYLPRRHRRPYDPAAGAAHDGRARRAEVVETAGSHAFYVSKPAEVARLIEQAATASVEVA